MVETVRLIIVIERNRNKMMYMEIDNFPIEKSLWDIKSLFSPALVDDIVLAYTDRECVWDNTRLTEEQKNNILVHIKNRYYTDLKRRNEKLEAEREYYFSVIKQLQDELKKKGRDKR